MPTMSLAHNQVRLGLYMDFAAAIKLWKLGHSLTRESWGNPSLRVRLEDDLFVRYIDLYSRYLPYSFASQDILANDWQIVDSA